MELIAVIHWWNPRSICTTLSFKMPSEFGRRLRDHTYFSPQGILYMPLCVCVCRSQLLLGIIYANLADVYQQCLVNQSIKLINFL